MWRCPFLNFCLIILLITFCAIQHSVAVFGPAGHASAASDSDSSQRFAFALDGKRPGSLQPPASYTRAAAFLDDTWHRGMVFEEWWMEYNASQWELFNASSPAETDLIEARFHVANAEVFTDAMSENDRAIEELDRAATLIHAAQTIVKAGVAAQLTIIGEELTAAEIREQTEDAFAGVPFETIKTNLDHLIEIVRLSKT